MDSIVYEKDDIGYQIAFPFKLFNDDHISSCHITEDETGLFTITDNGNVFKYYENNGILFENYQKKIKQICRMFHLCIEDGIIKRTLGEYETNQTFVQLMSFFVGISHLCTIKYLE